jgi:hypothetical protein
MKKILLLVGMAALAQIPAFATPAAAHERDHDRDRREPDGRHGAYYIDRYPYQRRHDGSYRTHRFDARDLERARERARWEQHRRRGHGGHHDGAWGRDGDRDRRHWGRDRHRGGSHEPGRGESHGHHGSHDRDSDHGRGGDHDRDGHHGGGHDGDHGGGGRGGRHQ